jgi:hypothetical protein
MLVARSTPRRTSKVVGSVTPLGEFEQRNVYDVTTSDSETDSEVRFRAPPWMESLCDDLA